MCLNLAPRDLECDSTSFTRDLECDLTSKKTLLTRDLECGLGYFEAVFLKDFAMDSPKIDVKRFEDPSPEDLEDVIFQ